jgi:prepilin-type N-terminal cleavage/methylation domain-containing protein
MRFFKRNEKGFTLVELLVAIPIIGLLGLAMGAVLIQLLHSDSINERMLAVRQVQVAGDRVSKDGIQAQDVAFGDDMTASDWSLHMTWSGDWMSDNSEHVMRSVDVTYTLEAAKGLYELKRYEIRQTTVNSTPQATEYYENIAGEYLDASQMYCQWTGSENGAFSIKLVSVVGTKTEERIYSITPRSG